MLTSIDRTAYPQFRGAISARELVESFTPTADEAGWARGKTTADQTFLVLVIWLKCYQRMRYFPGLDEVPDAVIGHMRTALGLPDDAAVGVEAVRSGARYCDYVCERLRVKYDAADVRGIAEAAIRAAAQTKDNAADLINVVLEELVGKGKELPGYTTLDRMVAKIRAEVNRDVFATDGHPVDLDDLATISPLITRTIRRFGDWIVDLTPPTHTPATRLDLEPWVLFATGRA